MIEEDDIKHNWDHWCQWMADNYNKERLSNKKEGYIMTTTDTEQFLVIRHGANTANQPMAYRMVLGVVEAEDIHEARKFANDHWTVYNNQRIEIQTNEEATSEDWNEAQERHEVFIA